MGCCTSCCGEDNGSQVNKSIPVPFFREIRRGGIAPCRDACLIVASSQGAFFINLLKFQSGEVTERTRLLEDPVSNNTNIQRVHSDDFLARYPSSLPKTSDEQSALNRILQETAS
jgi:hypothetical protein